ncbi:glycosyltransferase [bacterium NHP-B]|nr:glycosyltransferase [bacterium NHP-B]
MKSIYMSVVVPVYNEEANLEALYTRLTKVLDGLGKTYEIVFVNDGSRDKTASILKGFLSRKADVRVVELSQNYGQHMAIMAGFSHMRGMYAVTLDADMQTPPEELPKVIEKTEQGHDYVGTFRLKRKDNWFRTYVSLLVNRVRSSVTNVSMRDHGCMLRAYHHTIVEHILTSRDRSTLVPVLAYTYAKNFTEVGMHHAPRENDTSKYTFYKLARMYFDLFTGFSLVPLQLFTFVGMVISFLSGLLVVYLLVRRFVLGAEAEGVFTLFAITFSLLSFIITGIGILGEYVGRTYQLLQDRPRFLIRHIWDKESVPKDQRKVSR